MTWWGWCWLLVATFVAAVSMTRCSELEDQVVQERNLRASCEVKRGTDRATAKASLRVMKRCVQTLQRTQTWLGLSTGRWPDPQGDGPQPVSGNVGGP